MPYAIPGIIGAILWSFLYLQQFSPIVKGISSLGLGQPDFLGPNAILWSIANIETWDWAVLLPSIVNPFGVFLSRIYAAGAVSDDLLDAARVDGANEFLTFTIAMRLMVPALVTVLLFQIVVVWNIYFLPLVMLSDKSLYPIPLGLATWNSSIYGGTKAPILFPLIVTGSLISVIPLIVGSLFLQRYWRGGLSAGSVKG